MFEGIWMELEVIVTQYMPLEAISTCWDAIGMGLDVIVTCQVVICMVLKAIAT